MMLYLQNSAVGYMGSFMEWPFMDNFWFHSFLWEQCCVLCFYSCFMGYQSPIVSLCDIERIWHSQHSLNVDSRNIYWATSLCPAPDTQAKVGQATIVLSGDSILAEQKWHHSHSKHWGTTLLTSPCNLHSILKSHYMEKSTWSLWYQVSHTGSAHWTLGFFVTETR